MRIWTLHPQHLDSKGLVALWRETLLARHVLNGNTKGYRNHPQLVRFREARDPVAALDYYLSCVWQEADRRGYTFDRSKFNEVGVPEKITVTTGQVQYEKNHLINKLKIRDMNKFREVSGLKEVTVHPLFHIIEGEIEPWEKI